MAFKTEVPSPSLPGNTNEKRLPRDDDPNRDGPWRTFKSVWPQARYQSMPSRSRVRNGQLGSFGFLSAVAPFRVCSSVSPLQTVLETYIPVFLLTDSLSVGYDTGVISGALVTIKGDLGPSALSDGQKVRILWDKFCTLCASPSSLLSYRNLSPLRRPWVLCWVVLLQGPCQIGRVVD